MVVFREGTPQQVRQAAIDAVNGLVVGGYPLTYGESAYYVLIPGQRRPEALLAALETLRGFPAIAQTGIIYIDNPGGAAYRKPNDGGGFKKVDWSMYRAGAAGKTGRSRSKRRRPGVLGELRRIVTAARGRVNARRPSTDRWKNSQGGLRGTPFSLPVFCAEAGVTVLRRSVTAIIVGLEYDSHGGRSL